MKNAALDQIRSGVLYALIDRKNQLDFGRKGMSAVAIPLISMV